jgi:hypothetical protein
MKDDVERSSEESTAEGFSALERRRDSLLRKIEQDQELALSPEHAVEAEHRIARSVDELEEIADKTPPDK